MRVVVHDVAHHADKGQVDRVADGFAHRRRSAVFLALEIRERMDAAAGKELLLRVGRVAALHGRFQHGLEPRVGRARQVVDGPARQPVLAADLYRPQLPGREPCIAFVQRFDEREVGRQRAQLGCRSQLELGAFVDVERLIGVVGLRAHEIPARSALVEDEAVGHGGRIAGREQPRLAQMRALRGRRVAKALQQPAHRARHLRVERARDREVEPVDVVEARRLEQRHEARPHGVRSLPRSHEDADRRAGLVAEGRAGAQRRVAQRRRGDTGVRQHAQMAVGQVGELVAPGHEEIGRPALRDQQAQHLPVRESLLVETRCRRLTSGGRATRSPRRNRRRTRPTGRLPARSPRRSRSPPREAPC